MGFSICNPSPLGKMVKTLLGLAAGTLVATSVASETINLDCAFAVPSGPTMIPTTLGVVIERDWLKVSLRDPRLESPIKGRIERFDTKAIVLTWTTPRMPALHGINKAASGGDAWNFTLLIGKTELGQPIHVTVVYARAHDADAPYATGQSDGTCKGKLQK